MKSAEHSMHHTMVEGENSAKEYLKFLMVIIFITAAAYVLNNMFGASGWYEYLRWFMGIFFIIFATFKFIGYQMFALMFAGYDILAKRYKPYAYAYPIIELLLGILYLGNLLPGLRDLITVLIMAVGTVGVYQEIQKRSGIHCACLGNVIKLPLSTVSLVEDVGMGLMAVVMLLGR